MARGASSILGEVEQSCDMLVPELNRGESDAIAKSTETRGTGRLEYIHILSAGSSRC